jgi:hypothetical protein
MGASLHKCQKPCIFVKAGCVAAGLCFGLGLPDLTCEIVLSLHGRNFPPISLTSFGNLTFFDTGLFVSPRRDNVRNITIVRRVEEPIAATGGWG